MLSMHHAEAIMMSADCLKMSYHKELDQLCMKMIQDQLNEVRSLSNGSATGIRFAKVRTAWMRDPCK